MRMNSLYLETFNEKGFTLVEILVALVITGILMILVFGMMFFQMHSYDREGMLSDAQQNGRVAMDEMVRDIRMAGSGIPRVPIYTGRVTNSPFAGANTVYPIMIVRGVSATPQSLFDLSGTNTGVNDSIILIYSDPDASATALAQAMVSNFDSISVNSTAGFLPNTPFIITDGTKADMFIVTGNSGNVLQVSTGTSTYDMYNNITTGHQLNYTAGSGGYAPGSRVIPVKVVRYDWSPDFDNFPITRQWNEKIRQTLAEFFGTSISIPASIGYTAVNNTSQALRIEYSSRASSALTTSFVRGMPADPFDIGSVRLWLTARTARGVDNPTTPRTRILTSDIQPRSYLGY